jgi:LemA protein
LTPGAWVLVGLGVLLLVVFLAIYNGLVAARQRVKESWSDVDTELRRRHDLIPNLVATVKGYMTHEREILERLASLREQAESLRPGPATGGQLEVEGQIGAILGGLRFRMEAYPDLKASSSFLALQGELANTEDRIAGALRFFNGNVRDLNVKCESFPGNVVARAFGFTPAEFFKLEDETKRAAPKTGID